MTPSLEQKTSTGLKVSFTHQGNLPAHLLRVPCAVRSPSGTIKIRCIHIILVKKFWKKLLAGIQMQHENVSYFRQKKKEKRNLWGDPMVFCFPPTISTCTYSWQNILMLALRSLMLWDALSEGSAGRILPRHPQQHSWGRGQLQIYLHCNRKESTAYRRHQHTPSVQIDESNVESFRNFINKNCRLQ